MNKHYNLVILINCVIAFTMTTRARSFSAVSRGVQDKAVAHCSKRDMLFNTFNNAYNI